MDCSVCLEDFTIGTKILLCPNGHSFCKSCIYGLSDKKCPECRAAWKRNEDLKRNYKLEELISQLQTQAHVAKHPPSMADKTIRPRVKNTHNKVKQTTNGDQSVHRKSSRGIVPFCALVWFIFLSLAAFVAWRRYLKTQRSRQKFTCLELEADTIRSLATNASFAYLFADHSSGDITLPVASHGFEWKLGKQEDVLRDDMHGYDDNRNRPLDLCKEYCALFAQRAEFGVSHDLFNASVYDIRIVFPRSQEASAYFADQRTHGVLGTSQFINASSRRLSVSNDVTAQRKKHGDSLGDEFVVWYDSSHDLGKARDSVASESDDRRRRREIAAIYVCRIGRVIVMTQVSGNFKSVGTMFVSNFTYRHAQDAERRARRLEQFLGTEIPLAYSIQQAVNSNEGAGAET